MIIDPKTCAIEAAGILKDKKGQDILVLDISSIAVFSDYFVIATGISPIHVQALADEVERRLVSKGYRLKSKEGYKDGRWVLIDFYDVIVHIFTRSEREYYMLERLWADAKTIDLPSNSIDTKKDLQYNNKENPT
ncbi:ribosome silencing factor [Tepidanaerobacter acetatoxydans]|uniref:ribosome silencing factor n=1 Tax=Tepidanaerobacter acetatoxydans TaxID=499229 RepID=UPI001BD636FE|nr:ribosome silencing factor [Tepidanaerobacter acetatoxydans]